MFTVQEFMEKLGPKVAGIKLLDIEAYLRKSKVARKIAGYSNKQEGNDKRRTGLADPGLVPPLHAVEDFMFALAGASAGMFHLGLISLSNPDADGRISLTMNSGQDVELKYLLLNPAPPLQEVVEEARCIILAGGTMSPVGALYSSFLIILQLEKISDVTNQLFKLFMPQVISFTCSHIIPASSLLTVCLGKGPSGQVLNFKAAKQHDPKLESFLHIFCGSILTSFQIGELAQIISNLANIIPAGVVVFFPSYSFLSYTLQVWQANGTIHRIEKKKKVYMFYIILSSSS